MAINRFSMLEIETVIHRLICWGYWAFWMLDLSWKALNPRILSCCLVLIFKIKIVFVLFCLKYISTVSTRCIVLFQNHPQRYEKLICFHPYTATTNEKFIGSSQRGLVASLIQFKWTKYFRHDLTLVLEDTQCLNSISESSSEIWKTNLVNGVERWSRNPKVRVQIPLEPTNFSLVVAV